MAEIGSYINIAATLLKLQKFVKNLAPSFSSQTPAGLRPFDPIR